MSTTLLLSSGTLWRGVRDWQRRLEGGLAIKLKGASAARKLTQARAPPPVEWVAKGAADQHSQKELQVHHKLRRVARRRAACASKRVLASEVLRVRGRKGAAIAHAQDGWLPMLEAAVVGQPPVGDTMCGALAAKEPAQRKHERRGVRFLASARVGGERGQGRKKAQTSGACSGRACMPRCVRARAPCWHAPSAITAVVRPPPKVKFLLAKHAMGAQLIWEPRLLRVARVVRRERAVGELVEPVGRIALRIVERRILARRGLPRPAHARHRRRRQAAALRLEALHYRAAVR